MAVDGSGESRDVLDCDWNGCGLSRSRFLGPAAGVQSKSASSRTFSAPQQLPRAHIPTATNHLYLCHPAHKSNLHRSIAQTAYSQILIFASHPDTIHAHQTKTTNHNGFHKRLRTSPTNPSPNRNPLRPQSNQHPQKQIGGITLTTTLLYLSLQYHTSTRAQQSALLRHQHSLLTHIVSPSPPVAPVAARETRAGLAERLKDRWNAELEGNVRKLQRLDWEGVREGVEESVSSLWRKGFKGAREGLPDASRE